jgi:EAL and modified HD-GYP domain-containing signal transduction protein
VPAGASPNAPGQSVVDVFVARQPIFDRDGTVGAYELLYRRNSRDNWAEGTSANTMASDVIIHSFLNVGIEKMTDGRRAFVNFTRDMLTMGVHQLFNPKSVVIELLETVEVDDEVVSACQALVRAGYTLALDDFVYSPAFEPLLKIAHIVKLDVLDRTEAQLREVVAQLKGHPVRLLAERVETREVRTQCAALGFELFQGYFFSRPEILTKRDLSADEITIVRLMNLLRDPDTNDAKLEEAFRGNLSLTYKLLRAVNSAASGGRGIESIQHAIRLTGRRELHKWLALLLLSSVSMKGGMDRELAFTAVQRARLCELIAESSGQRGSSGALFIVGLFSLLDAIMRIPMADMLDRLDLAPEVVEALLRRSGPFGAPLTLVEAYERGAWDDVSRIAREVGVPANKMPELYVDSLVWAREKAGVGD